MPALKFSLLFPFILLLFSCNRTNRNKAYFNYIKEVPLSELENGIIIKNNTGNSARFYLNINHQFPLTPTSILQATDSISIKEKISPEQSVWKFVTGNTFHSAPYSENIWNHEPLLFLNSIGGGLCGELAVVLAKLWKEKGFKARVIYLNGHVVAEVFTNNKWKLFDPDHVIFYVDSNQNICSLKDIEKNSKPLYTLASKDKNYNYFYQSKNSISDRVEHYFKSTIDNTIDSNILPNSTIPPLEFILPAGCSLVFHKDIKTGTYSATVKFSKHTSGILQIPLVPTEANGNFSAEFNTELIKINGIKELPKENFIQSINIKSASAESGIRYLINPKLDFLHLNSLNHVSVLSNSLLTIEPISISTNNYKNFGQLFFLLNQKSFQYRDFLVHANNLNNKHTDISSANSLYTQFLSFDNQLSDNEKTILSKKFNLDFTEAFTKAGSNVLQKELHEQYPRAIFYFMVASKYNRIEELN